MNSDDHIIFDLYSEIFAIDFAKKHFKLEYNVGFPAEPY